MFGSRMINTPAADVVAGLIDNFVRTIQTNERRRPVFFLKQGSGNTRTILAGRMQAIARELAGSRGGNILFSGLNFSLAAGEGLAVSGPNGVGKSTLLRILAGLLPTTSGNFNLNGANGAALPVFEFAHYLGHRNSMKAELTVAENLKFWKSYQAGEEEAGLEVEEAIDAVGLDGVGHLPFGYLSAGQKRRIALARLLVAERPLWLLDEPTAALDRRSEQLFRDIAADHLAAGGMLIAATHLPLGIDGLGSLVMEPSAAKAHDSGVSW